MSRRRNTLCGSSNPSLCEAGKARPFRIPNTLFAGSGDIQDIDLLTTHYARILWPVNSLEYSLSKIENYLY